jgi:Laminin B (Domain IV)
MRIGHRAVALVLGCMSAVAGAQVLAVSGFKEGDENWSVQNGAGNFLWLATGGDPGGYIRALEVPEPASLWFFSAPAAFLGDKAAAYGGTLSFSMRSNWSPPEITAPHASVQLLGANGVLLALQGDVPPALDWTRYAVPLVADGNWKLDSVNGSAATAADMHAVLSDLLALRINGDFGQGIEVSGLDSVVLSAVPEPAAMGLFLAGLTVVVGHARRRAGRSG